MKNYSTAYDEIREDCRLDTIEDFRDEFAWNLESDRLLDPDEVSEDYLDYLVGFE